MAKLTWGKCLGLLASTALLAAPLTAAAQTETTLQRIARTGTVVIGYRESSMPFSYLDDNKRPIGYSIDLCQRIVKALSKQLGKDLKTEYKLVTSANRVDAVAEGQVDLECGSTTNNAERRKRVAFTVPHFITATRFMVNKATISNYDDLQRATVVTTRGTTAEKLFPQLNLRSKLELAPDHAAAFAMLESGKADAFLMDDILLASLRTTAKDPDRYRILDEAQRVEVLAIMLTRDDPNFKSAVDREMTRLVNEGEATALYHKWFEQPIPPKGVNLRMQMGHLLRDNFRFPTDWAPD